MYTTNPRNYRPGLGAKLAQEDAEPLAQSSPIIASGGSTLGLQPKVVRVWPSVVTESVPVFIQEVIKYGVVPRAQADSIVDNLVHRGGGSYTVTGTKEGQKQTITVVASAKPTTPPDDGYEWVYDKAYGTWVQQKKSSLLGGVVGAIVSPITLIAKGATEVGKVGAQAIGTVGGLVASGAEQLAKGAYGAGSLAVEGVTEAAKLAAEGAEQAGKGLYQVGKFGVEHIDDIAPIAANFLIPGSGSIVAGALDFLGGGGSPPTAQGFAPIVMPNGTEVHTLPQGYQGYPSAPAGALPPWVLGALVFGGVLLLSDNSRRGR